MAVSRQELERALASGHRTIISHAYLRLAYAQQFSGALPEAHESLLKALSEIRAAEHMPADEMEALTRIGESLRGLKRGREALKYFQEAIEIVERLRRDMVPTEKSRAAWAADTKGSSTK